MKLIKPSFTIIDQPSGIEGIYKQIELAGRTCYKSEDKITDSSAKEFVERLIKLGHGAMLEHGTVYLKVPSEVDECGDVNEIVNNYRFNKFSAVRGKYTPFTKSNFYITTNYRVLVENEWLEDLKYLCEPTEFHEKRIAVKFICDRGVSHEFVRHRVFSFAQESTRYCNYSQDRFSNELTFIEPSWLDKQDETYYNIWKSSIIHSENAYLDLLKQWDKKILDLRFKSGYKNNPWTPQQARSVLPNSLKTELVMTGTVEQWKGFFKLRCSTTAHPQARELAIPLQDEFKKNLYI